MLSSLTFAALINVATVASVPNWVSPGDEAHYLRFSEFVVEFNKNYANEQERVERFLFFKENMKISEELNVLHNGTAEFGATKFSDMSAEEFAAKILSKPRPPTAEMMHNYTRPNVLGYDPAKDWGSYITSVKDQGQICGSCWSFTALGEMESKLLMKGRGTFMLSTQQLVDCDPYDTGCDGGFYDRAWRYIYSTGGVMDWTEYPYTARKGTCRFNAGRVRAKLAQANAYQCGNSPTAIYDCVFNYGPAAAALDATPLQNYRNGILNLNAAYCSNLNHAVLMVGYSSVGSAYFRIRNSWGANWGEQGFFRINPTSCLINNFVMGSYVL